MIALGRAPNELPAAETETGGAFCGLANTWTERGPVRAGGALI